MAPFKIISFLSIVFILCDSAKADVLQYNKLNAEKINYDIKTGEVKTVGKTDVTLKTGQKITLQDAYLDRKNAEGKDVVIEWNKNTLMTARNFEKDGILTHAKHVSYTACNNCDDIGTAWTLHAQSMTHDSQSKTMYFYNFWFDAYGMPLLYSPFWSQPDPTVKHKSGILTPQLGTSTNNGTKIDIPIYFSFSDSHDLTITTSYLSRENPVINAEHRLVFEHSSFNTIGSYTHTMDDLNRWHFFHNDTIDLGDNMRISTNIARTSDKTYLQQYDLYGDQPFLESSAKLEVFGLNGYMTFGANVFQELRQQLANSNEFVPKGDILPRVHGTYQFGIAKDMYSEFTGDLLRIDDNKNGSATNRAIGEVRLIAPIETMWQKWTFSAALRDDYYNYNNVVGATDDSATRVLPSGYVDWEMPFVKTGDNWTQVIKPKARLTMIGKSDNNNFINMDSTGALLSDTSLFQNNRYSGYDLWVNGTYSDYGLSWTGYNGAGQSAEVFVGQTYDFDDKDLVDINSGYGNGASDIVGRVAINPKEWLGFTNRFRFGKDDLDLRHLETDVKIGTRNYVTLGYIWAVQFSKANDAYIRDDNISEGSVDTGVYITKMLAFRASSIYNFTNGLSQRYNAGIYYEHPCYLIGLVYDVDNAVKVYNNTASDNLDFKGVRTLKLKFSIKMGA